MGCTAEAAKCVVHLGRSHPREDPSCSGLVPTAKTTLNPAHDRPGKKSLAQGAAIRRHHHSHIGHLVRVPRPAPGTDVDTLSSTIPETVSVSDTLIAELRDRIAELQARLTSVDAERASLRQEMAQERAATAQERMAAHEAATAQVVALNVLLEEMRRDRDR